MIKPFDFHYKLRDYFRQQEKTWNWFAGTVVKQEQTEKLKSDLLKNTYRMDPVSEPDIYRLLKTAADKLGVVVPVTVYQSQNTGLSNAGIIYFNNEAHLVLSGPVVSLLDENELLALLAHELSHVLLESADNGDFEITHRIITAIANDYRSDDSYIETARLYNLFTELYCDIGACIVCGSSDTVISTLVKINTGLGKISPQKYLVQADEILAKEENVSQGETHPEAFIRAKAVALFSEKQEASLPEIEKLIIGKPDLYTLQLFSRAEVHETTRELIQLVTKPRWMQGELVRALYRQYFQDFKTDSEAMIGTALKEKVQHVHESLKDYYAFVMLDFALCDPDMSEPACGHLLDLAEQLGIEKILGVVMKRELKMNDKKFQAFAQQCAAALNSIMEADREKTY